MRPYPVSQLACATILFALASCSGQKTSDPAEFRILNPGPIVKVQGDPFHLVGRFTVVPDASGSGITDRSHGSGGACIVGDLAKHGAPEMACTDNKVCNDALIAYRQANAGNANIQKINTGGGYCIAQRCWYRPTGGSCVRKSFAADGPWPVGTHEIAPPRYDHIEALYGADAKIDWQVVTCAHRAKADGTDAGAVNGQPEPGSCGASQGIYRPPQT
jgi:hypothetical protein